MPPRAPRFPWQGPPGLGLQLFVREPLVTRDGGPGRVAVGESRARPRLDDEVIEYSSFPGDLAHLRLGGREGRLGLSGVAVGELAQLRGGDEDDGTEQADPPL